MRSVPDEIVFASVICEIGKLFSVSIERIVGREDERTVSVVVCCDHEFR